METREQLKQLEEKVAMGLEKAYEKMAAFKKQKNSPLVISKNGKVVRIPAEEILPTTKAMNPYPTDPSHNQSTDHS